MLGRKTLLLGEEEECIKLFDQVFVLSHVASRFGTYCNVLVASFYSTCKMCPNELKEHTI